MSSISKIRLNGELYDIKISGGNVTGVKGNAETNYRSGNVNITKEDIGCDEMPTKGSNNLISSNGVYEYIDIMITQALNASY